MLAEEALQLSHLPNPKLSPFSLLFLVVLCGEPSSPGHSGKHTTIELHPKPEHSWFLPLNHKIIIVTSSGNIYFARVNKNWAKPFPLPDSPTAKPT